MNPVGGAEVEDTFAEAFRSIYAEILVTARDRKWLDEAVRACAGNVDEPRNGRACKESAQAKCRQSRQELQTAKLA